MLSVISPNSYETHTQSETDVMLKVITLGTGCALPTPERNLSSTAVVREGDLLLFDCGEAAQIQVRRAGLKLSRLRRMFISHLHGDHVTGLVGLLMTLTMTDRSEPLEIYGPVELAEYLESCRRLLGLRFTYPVRCHPAHPGVLCEAKDYTVSCRSLRHRVPTFGYAFREKDRPGRFLVERAQELNIPEGPLFGRLQRGEEIALSDGRTVSPSQVLGPPRRGMKIAYCLDTALCPEAEHLARGADLVIHDSTFAPGDEVRAAEQGHSTSLQAAILARDAGARQLILTHISARYTDEQIVLGPAREIFPNTLLARDLMEIEVERIED